MLGEFVQDTFSAARSQFMNAVDVRNVPLMLGTIAGVVVGVGTVAVVGRKGVATTKALLSGDVTFAGKEVTKFPAEWVDQQMEILNALKGKRKYSKRGGKNGN